jgi:hypothetical protein
MPTTQPPRRSQVQRMSRYVWRETDPEEVTSTLLVTRDGDQVELRFSRLAKGRSTEIATTLAGEERRDLVKLLS